MPYLIRRIFETPFLVLLKMLRIKYFQHFGLSFVNRTSSLNDSIIKGDLKSLNRVNLNNLRINEEYRCLGYGDLEMECYSDWYFDDFHGYRFPKKKSIKIDYVSIKKEYDVKVVWEKSRLQFALRQAIKYKLGHGDPCRDYALELLESWIRENPFRYGPNWISSMEVAIRGLNMYLTYLFLLETLKTNEKASIHSSLYQHFIHLKYLPEYSDVNGNHYLFTLIGKAALGRLFCQDLHRTLREIEEQIELQFDETGAHFENSPSYSRFCLEGIQVLLFFVDSETIGAKLRTLANKLKQYAYNDQIVEYGDFDDGSIFDYDQNFEFINLFSDEYIHGCLYPIKLSEDQELPTGIYGNIAYINCHNHFATIRYGKAGLRGRASHDHDDVLSLRLFLSGKEILKEYGTPSYSYDSVLREKCLSSLSHNVIQVGKGVRFESVQGSVVRTVRGLHTANLKHLREGFLEVDYEQVLTDRVVRINRSVTIQKDYIVVDDLLHECAEVIQCWYLNTIQEIRNFSVDSNTLSFAFETQDRLYCKMMIKADGELKYNQELLDYYPRYAKKDKILKLTIMSKGVSEIKTSFCEG